MPINRYEDSTVAHYWNKKYEKVGHIFQGRYKALLCQEEKYLLELVRYTHLNACKAGLVNLPEEYRWCSHRNYLHPETNKFVHTKLVNSYLPTIESFDDFIKSKVTLENELIS